MNTVAFLFYFYLFWGAGEAVLPVVMWHGMGDSCCSDGSLGKIINIIKDELPGVEVLSLKFGNSTIADVESGYFKDTNKQVAEACETLRTDPRFKDGYNAVGFSQGGQFLRAVAQRCPVPKMVSLISLGGQHQGVYGLPNCGQPTPAWCDYIRKLLNYGAYVGWVQSSLVQAQYWHDPLDEEGYKTHSLFLADINNEKTEKNASYITNLQLLNKLVLVKFNQDSMVTPRESSWFGFYAPGQSTEVIPFEKTTLFIEDLIGLRRMLAEGKVDFLSVDGNHLEFTTEWFTENIIKTYLA